MTEEIKDESLADYVTRLKQENENAKTTVEECHKYMAKLEDENEKLLEQKNSVMATNIKYFMALEEIKSLCDFNYTFSATNSLAKEIFNIANEVLGNESN